jgi:hypothetical protein
MTVVVILRVSLGRDGLVADADSFSPTGDRERPSVPEPELVTSVSQGQARINVGQVSDPTAHRPIA